MVGSRSWIPRFNSLNGLDNIREHVYEAGLASSVTWVTPIPFVPHLLLWLVGTSVLLLPIPVEREAN